MEDDTQAPRHLPDELLARRHEPHIRAAKAQRVADRLPFGDDDIGAKRTGRFEQANGGTLFRPQVVSKIESVDGATIREYGPEVIRKIDLNPSTLERIHKALADVVQGASGTGRAARSSLVEIAGKTGTAQVIEMKGAYLKNEQLAYFHRDHAWFVAYAPARNPQIAVVVLVEHGGGGGSVAAPLAKPVIEKFIELQHRPTGQQQARVEGTSRAD